VVLHELHVHEIELQMQNEELRRSHVELEQARDRYRDLYDFAPVGYLTLSPEGRIIECNFAAGALLGWDRKDLHGHAFAQHLTQEDADRWHLHIKRTLESDAPLSCELDLKRSDDSRVTVILESRRRTPNGSPVVIATLTDISSRRQAEAALTASLELTQSVIDGSQSLIYVLDLEGRFRLVNARVAALFKLPTGQIVGKSRESFFPVAIAHEHRRNDLLAMNKGEYVEVEESNQETDGEHCYLSQRFPLFDGQATVVGVCGISTDITERKRTQSKLEHITRALLSLSSVNHHLVHAENEAQLLQSICQDVVKVNGYQMGWVGYVQHDQAKSIEVVARSEHEEGYVSWAQLTWAETPHGMGPTGRAIRSRQPQVCLDLANDQSYLPWREEALLRGYRSLISLPLVDRDSAQVFGVFNLYSDDLNAFIPDEVALLEEMAGDLAFGVRALRIRNERDLVLLKNQQQVAQLQDSLEDTVRAIATIGELRDPYTAGHQSRVAQLALALAKQMGLSQENAHAVYVAGVLHDLGKIRIPAEILSKPGKISAIEYALIQTHAHAGYEILKGISFPFPIAQMVLQHHERLDGSGYPQGLKGDAIMLEARILAVADVVEAMSSHRPYRAGMGVEVALKEIEKGSAKVFDPQVVEACLTLFRDTDFSFES
jgi:PAS domain S-box-containing protein/putative nucleotidyltransferase with HDIG domain